MHIAIIGTGRVGQMLALALTYEPYLTHLTLVDTKPNLAQAVAYEIQHALSIHPHHFEITAAENANKVKAADIVVVCAGTPRTPQMKDRRDLTRINAVTIKSIAASVTLRNSDAKYIIVTNPVDSMAMLFARYSQAKFVLGTGTSLDTLRFRSELTKYFQVPAAQITGFVAGEHGSHAVFLWSTVKINGIPLELYLAKRHLQFDKKIIINSVKTVSKTIIDVIGGTAPGPAAAFGEIIRAIALNTNQLLSVAIPHQIPSVNQPVFVSLPLKIGEYIGADFGKKLTATEKQEIQIAAAEIYATFQEAVEAVS